MSALLLQALTGLAHAATLFLVAAGLSVIFGVTRIVNFAHGSLYMLGAYLAYSTAQFLQDRFDGAGFWLGIVAAALAVGLLGIALEFLVLRRIYRAPELFQLLATFGVVLVVQDAVLSIWGSEDLFASRAPGLKGTVEIFGERFPQYHLFLIVLGVLVLGGLWLLQHRTRWGVLLRAATLDREMVGALGVNQKLLFSGAVFLGALLAGLSGALQIPKEAVNLQMDLHTLTEAFVVVVIGGMGSITGAYLASLLVGLLSAFGVLLFPQLTLMLTFVVMALVLLVRPHGLLGRAEAPTAHGHAAPLAIAVPRSGESLMVAALLAILLAMPWTAGEYTMLLVTEILILVLFAASLHFVMSIGGMVSFGHAAWFGIGAYVAGLLVREWSTGVWSALVVAPLATAAVTLLFGWFVIRSSGVYLAMLTLAFAQILWSIAVQSDWTGGDNGILGIWPGGILRSAIAYYYFTLAVVALGVFGLRRTIFSPFGYALRAGRDAPARADAIGIDVQRFRWLAFGIAGTLAGLAGMLHAFHKGSVFPDLLAIGQSVDALVMVLLGGVNTISGPLVGAAVYHGATAEAMRSLPHWRAALGLAIILLCLVFPQGIVGSARLLMRRLGTAGGAKNARP